MKTAALLEKYCQPGPRYTSYPTAPYFQTGFTDADWRTELEATRHSPRGLSLYTHIPFCDTLCWYCGCNMVATRDYGRAERYLDWLFREIDLVTGLVAPERVVKQLHWGGGTPTFLRPEDIERLFGHLLAGFTLDPQAEIGCEADPRELSRDHVETLKRLGFNRISLGVQDLDERVQRTVNRVQPEALIREVYGWMRGAGFESINLDLMTGLPHQTVESFSRTLDAVINLRPDRLAVFTYAHVPWMKRHQKLIPEADLPDFPTRIALQALILDRLAGAGYVYIGMDHYALPDDELVLAQKSKTLYRNFQGYTTHRECDILAFGASAISQTGEVYAQNLKPLPEYRDRVLAGRLPTERGIRTTRDDRLRREAITCIMCDLELDTAAFGREWDVDFEDYFACRAGLESLAADGLLSLEGGLIRVSDTGRLFLRNIAMLFDGHLQAPAADAGPRYSKTV
ncbi:oxygen-independent coproporphyrinogen-3 oxidase [Methylomagnum ishizawai]|uniref:Coproporphyrinogen-III oxidase n=1 Tax=Methylomagnum ishizawai TaxID=1760988 RepID=A0A1Y6DC22_9GAMM|nr:oxygen-independent coproporphyrinogen III oxidase [Methylomagnum ishizawai]SMF97155.1 oxygen-independent coproporphyrinogen-3 oxidase [Methylomagnum ishizawai]